MGMDKPKFTKGPWQAGRPDMATLVDGAKSKWIYAGDTYCAIASGADIDDWYEVMANAHLIAAAPEMYDLLSDLLRNYELGEKVDSQIVAVLTKAEGGA